MKKPIVMGAVMGAMMMWMLHGLLMGETAMGAVAVMVFVGSHVLLVALALGAALFASRMSPRTRAWIDRLHRPSLHHVAVMLGSAAILAGLVHVSAHGLGGI